MQETKPVVIVGGGVVGLSTAYYALRAGLPVTVVEREPEGGDCCSLGNAGLVVPSHFVPLAAPGMIAQGLRWMFSRESPFFIRPRLSPELARWAWLFQRSATAAHVAATRELLCELNLESRRLFAELAEEDGFGLEKKGMLMLCRSEKALEEEVATARDARELGLRVEVLDAAGVAAADPGTRMDVVGGVHFLDDCHLDPARFMERLRQRVLALGGLIEHRVEIDGFETTGGRLTAVTGGGRRFEGGHFVVAGGSWSAELLRRVGLRLPLQAGKGYSLTLPEPRELPRLPSVLVEARVAVTPMASSLRFAGTMEVSGLDRSIDPLRVRGIVKSVSRYFPNFSEADFEGIEPWAGLRPVSPDGVPYLGLVPGFDNLIAATGHAMMGLSLGPVSGRLVTDLITGREPFRPIGQMAVGRFG